MELEFLRLEYGAEIWAMGFWRLRYWPDVKYRCPVFYWKGDRPLPKRIRVGRGEWEWMGHKTQLWERYD